MQPSQTPEEARVPKANGKHISEDLNIVFFSKIIDNVYKVINSLLSLNAVRITFVQLSQQ